MKVHVHRRLSACRLLNLAALAGLLVCMPVQAALNLATKPLTTSTTTSVLPNLMFIMDGSGSMDWDYLPDWANDSTCKNTDGDYDRNCAAQPPYRSADFNGIYYNPEIRYTPAVNADGTSKATQGSPWTAVKNDAYNIQSTGSTNLVSGYPDLEWCTSDSYTDCLRNDNYILPGDVNGKSYRVSRTTTASGTKSVVSGAPRSSTNVVTSKAVGPHYYSITPGEYCDTPKLESCQPSQTTTFKYPAKLRWCSSNANASAPLPEAGSCQALRTGIFTRPRYPTRFGSNGTPYIPAQPAVAATATIVLSMSGCRDTRRAGIAQITVNGVTGILPSATGNYQSENDLAAAVRSKTAQSGYQFSGSNNRIVITAPVSAGAITHSVELTRTANSDSRCQFSPTTATFGGYQPAAAAQAAQPAYSPGAFVRTDIVPASAGGSDTYPRASGRTDCVSSTTTCSYTEEMTNFANWWTYYHTRMQAMKTAVSIAFKPIDNRYRVGFIDLWGNNYLPIATFNSGTGSVKADWYAKLFSMNPNNGTPLRRALSNVGRIYAGQVGASDPIQYSCQQNFALLTTDGYWNSDASSDIRAITSGSVGNMDGGTTPRPMREGPTAVSNTLADVAKYYYDTDLRTPALGNCLANGLNVCENNVMVTNTDLNQQQHMTTFTLGLGVEGTLSYTSDYKTASAGDFHDLVTGTRNWPTPVADSETAVDDLWHAAVNGQGTYFSAKDPSQLTSGLSSALAAIGSTLGAGAAAATSTLNPVAGNNFAYVASYTTVKWQGNLEARTIDVNTGEVSRSATWSAEDVVTGICSAPGTVVAEISGADTVYKCVTPSQTVDTCPTLAGQTLVGTNCKKDMTIAKQGTMAAKVGPDTDSRTIYMAQGGALTPFIHANLTVDQQAFFTGASLSQWGEFDTQQKASAAGPNLVNFLRGQNGYEDRSSNVVDGVNNKLFRFREAVLGDAVESQPAFVGKPFFSYTDAGYSAFVTAKEGRAKTVFLGANDGMMHAFNATNGDERWAFVPTMVMPHMWRLADKNYGTMHTNFVNGKPVIADVCPNTNGICTASEWRTILVAGLNGGGRGYYALDITNPASPSLLWEIDSRAENTLGDSAIGYSFGPPLITKRLDGRWVVLLTSGYNNSENGQGDGRGYVFVRNAYTGTTTGISVNKIPTGVGTVANPSGLAKLSGWADDPMRNNTTTYAYGGDLLGNLWRFNINASTVADAVMKFAVLKDPSGDEQPITTAPELGAILGKRAVFVATGKYLEESDLIADQVQTLYAIKDAEATTVLDNPRASADMVQQTLSNNTATATRTSSTNAVNFSSNRGWFIDLSDTGERAHVDPKLDAGLLIVPTTVPSDVVCSPGGYGWLNYFNYRTGNNLTDIVSQKFSAPIVGINVFYTQDGKRHIGVVTSTNPTPEPPGKPPPPVESPAGFMGKRAIWRELIEE